MKLWQKLSLMTVIVLFISTALSGAAMIWYTAHYNEMKTLENYEQQLQAAALNLATELSSDVIESYSEVTKKSYLNFVIRKYGANQYILLEGDEVVCNLSAFELVNPEMDMFGQAEVESVIQKKGNQYVLAAGRSIAAADRKDYRLILVRDISEVYGDIQKQAVLFGILYLMGSMIAVSLIFFFTKRILKPLQSLKRAAEGIQKGCLEHRVQVKTRDEVGIVADAFNRMAEQIEEQVKALSQVAEQRRQMMGSLAHEMKTPMTSIIGYADTLLHVNVREEQRERAIRHIYEESRRLERLGSKLMKLIGLYDNDSICMETTDMEALFLRVAELEKHPLELQNISLLTACRMEEQKVDRDLFESLLVNLIDNAAKASREGDTIFLEGKENVITVKDQGLGIPKEEIGRVTEAFYMVDKARSRRAGGCGLGLSLCSRIAALHNAKLVIESEEGRGTTVFVILP